MLYVTTRNHEDTYTAHKATRDERGPDGGLFIPFRIPVYTWEEILQLSQMPFNQCMAQILNRFLQTQFTGWDLDFGIGRFPVRLERLSHRIIMGESWHNPDWDFEHIVHRISGLIHADRDEREAPSFWLKTCVRISVMFGIFAEFIREGIAARDNLVDVSVVCGDFSAPISVWYAKAMGLPIGNIVLCCNENNAVWNLMQAGQFRTDAVCIHTDTPDADISLPYALEALISVCCGTREVDRYLEICRRGKMYCPDEKTLQRLNYGMQVSVISSHRMKDTIPSVFGTNQYLLSPYAALSYAGLLDYRARTGASGYALVLSETGPERDPQIVAKALGITMDELQAHFKII